ERSRESVVQGSCDRVGLLATQSIRSGRNRSVLERILDTGSIFWAWSDRPWILDGASVRVSMIAFDAGHEQTLMLNGVKSSRINSNLTSSLDVTTAHRL